jgi:hypothetical protein
VEEEWKKLHEAFSDLQENSVILERLNKATVSSLQQKLQKEDYHIFHFIGHGDFDEQASEGTLVFENEEKMSNSVSSKYLVTLLGGLNLVIINACKGAYTSHRHHFAGIAQSLARDGIPAVIAMQHEITDETAITFTQAFYGTLANGLPVDAAMAEARKAIFVSKSVEWGTPVLYMRSPDGYIFDLKPDATMTIEETDQANATKLRQILTKNFNEGELRTLCFDLRSMEPEIDYDSLPGIGKADKARELVLYFEQRGHLSVLISICRKLRPKAPW